MIDWHRPIALKIPIYIFSIFIHIKTPFTQLIEHAFEIWWISLEATASDAASRVSPYTLENLQYLRLATTSTKRTINYKFEHWKQLDIPIFARWYICIHVGFSVPLNYKRKKSCTHVYTSLVYIYIHTGDWIILHNLLCMQSRLCDCTVYFKWESIHLMLSNILLSFGTQWIRLWYYLRKSPRRVSNWTAKQTQRVKTFSHVHPHSHPPHPTTTLSVGLSVCVYNCLRCIYCTSVVIVCTLVFVWGFHFVCVPLIKHSNLLCKRIINTLPPAFGGWISS